MPDSPRNRIELCGRLSVELGDRRVEDALPGRQGKLVFAYLTLERDRPTSRDELIELLWPQTPPADPDEALSALLSKLRRALGAGVLEGRTDLTMSLPPDTWVDIEAAEQAIDRAQSALARADAPAAWRDAHAALEVASRGFFVRHDNPWVERRRRDLEELRLRCLECVASAGLELGGSELVAAERAARALIESAPFRETGHRLLMEALAARGNVAEALKAYDELRVLLRDELGTSPDAAVQELHQRLLAAGERDEGDVAVAERPELEEAPSEPPSPREERRPVTVLFTELVLPATGSEQLDPERLRAALAPYHERMREEFERLGAMIEKPTGPALMAVFGAPRLHEDDPQRAVTAALRLAALVGDLNESIGVVALAATTAVATGEALVALHDSAEGGERAVAGEVVGRAFHLHRLAPTGAVVVDEPTHRATQGSIDYERLETVAFEEEGEEAVAHWRATVARAGPPTRAEHVTPTRFVGRDHELTLLDSLYRSVVDEARPRFVTILGQAGVGKTRLTDELVSRVGVERPETAFYRGRCLPYGAGITYWALREVLWQVAGIQLDDTGATAGEKLSFLVRDLTASGAYPAEAERVTFALAISSGISLADNPLEGLSPESIAEEVGIAWPRLLSALAADAPVALVIEDLHWAEPPLLEMVEQLVSRSSGRLLLVATARPEFAETRSGWTSRPRMSQIGLEPLTEAQSGELVAELLPGVGPDLRDKVASVAEGNPFFAEEIVRHLIDEGALVRKRKELSEARPDTEIAIPPTVRAVLAARIDALPDAEKRTIQDAAVVGRSFWITTLESMRADASIRASLRSMEEKGLVATRPGTSLPGQPELTFRHALTREVAYASIPRARRCRAHAEVAGWIERLTADRREEFIDLLAHHYEAAASPDDADLAWPRDSPGRQDVRRKAVAALLDAGRAAHKRVAVDQAIGYGNRALALADTDAERLAAVEVKARALHGAIRADEALAAYREAVGIARKLGDGESATRLAAHAALLCARYGGAFSDEGWREGSRELVEGILVGQDRDSGSFADGALLVWRGSMARRFGSTQDRETARRDAERAVEIAETIDSPFLLAYALEGLWNLTLQDGLCEQTAMGERMLKLGKTMADRVEAHETLVGAAMAFARAGRHDEAEAVADEAATRAADLSPHRRLHAAAAAAICLLPSGRLGKLGEATAGVVELIHEESGRICPYASLALAAHALALFEAGEAGAARRAAELLDVAGPQPRSLRYGAVEVVRPLIGLEETRRKLESMKGARDTLTEIASLRAELQLSALSGEWDRLEGLIGEARALSGPACAPALASLADWAEAVRLAREGRPAEAVERARAAAAALERDGERYAAARLLVDMLPFLDPPGARALGDEATSRLEAMGARGSAAEARRASGARS